MAPTALLGLGSRANASPPAVAQPQSSSVFKKAATATATATATTPNHTPKRRRGFGLFDSEDEYDSEQQQPKEVVQFSGDLSGFANMSDSEGPISRSPTKTSSRTSKLTTPRRRSAVSSRRGTPYTTSRALMRARRGSKESDNEEEMLISESMFGASPNASPGKKGGKARFVMSGALGCSEDEQLSTEVDTDPELYKTPSRELFSRKAKTSRQQFADAGQLKGDSGVAKKTWGQWLKSILPTVVVKPVESIIHPPHTPPLARLERIQPDTPPFMTPERDPRDGEDLSIPGSFEKPAALPPPLPPPPPPFPKDDKNFINPNFLNSDSHRTPTRNADGLFTYSNPSPSPSTHSNSSQSPASAKKGSRAPSAPTSARRMMSASPPAASYRKTSNFIERMRNAKKQKRYDPYSRPSSSPKKAGRTIAPLQHEEVSAGLTPEEELEQLERREKDRKVQEAEDRYLRRETLRRLGRPVQDDEEMSDSAAEASCEKGKGRAADAQDMEDSMQEDRVGSTTPPDSPPPQQARSIFKASGTPLFQFQNTAPKPAATGAGVEKTASADQSPVDKPLFSFGPTALFGEADSDKENMSQPAPSPPPAAAGAPAAVAPAAAAVAPAPVAATAPVAGIFGEKQSGGFGVSEAGSSSSSSMSPMRQRFDKFKPRVSSGLRESATIEKENEHDKENPSDNTANGNGNGYSYNYNIANHAGTNTNNGEGSSSSGAAQGKAGKAAFGTQVVPKQPSQFSSSSSALREVGRNSTTGTAVKIDVRAKIAALPVRDLSPIAAWPISLEVMKGGSSDAKMMSEYVSTAFAASSSEGWLTGWAVGELFGAARGKIERI